MKIVITKEWLKASLALGDDSECGVGGLDICSTTEESTMSYSFNVRAANKPAAIQAVAAELEKVAERMPEHKQDIGAALSAANQQINLLADDSNRDIVVACNGYLSWTGSVADNNMTITGACQGCTANLATRPTEQVVGSAVLG